MEGCEKALFETRKIARWYCNRIEESPDYQAKVVKVRVTVEELK
jgi:hypothetical protein